MPSERLTIFAIDGRQCLSTFLGMLWGWCQVCMILMAFHVWFCRFLYQCWKSLQMCCVIWFWYVFMCACVVLCSVFYWRRMPQNLWLVVGLMLILVVGSFCFGQLFPWFFCKVFCCLCFLYWSGCILNCNFCIWALWQIYSIPFWMSSSVGSPCIWSISFLCFSGSFFGFLGLYHTRVFCVCWLLFLLWLGQISWLFWAFHFWVSWLPYWVLCFPGWVCCWIHFLIVWLHHWWILTRFSFLVLV